MQIKKLIIDKSGSRVGTGAEDEGVCYGEVGGRGSAGGTGREAGHIRTR